MLSQMSREGSDGLMFVIGNMDSSLVVSKAAKDLPGSIAGIQVGDTITKINNVQITPDLDRSKLTGRRLVGTVITYTVRRNNIEKDYKVTLAPSPVLDKLVNAVFRIVPVILMLVYVLVGFWGIVKSPYSNVTILIALFCFSFGSFMYATVGTVTDPEHFVRKYFYFDSLRDFLGYFMIYSTSFWLLLFAIFPQPNRQYTSHKLLSLLFIFLLPIITTLNYLIPITNTFFTIITFVLLFMNMTLGISLLNYNSKKVKSILERRQLRLMLAGVKYGAVSAGLGWVIVIIFNFFLGATISKDILLISFLVYLACEIGGLIIPFTFLNSFFQKKLLETENALRKRVRYTIVTISMLAVYVSALYVIGNISVSIFELQDRSLIIIVILLLSLTFAPINRRLIRWVDEKFYPERTKYSESLKNFIRNISSFIDSSEILSSLIKWISETTKIYPVIPVTLESHTYYPFNPEEQNSVINKLRDGSKFFWDEVTEKSTTHIKENEIQWAKENDISLTVGMISQGELVGVLNLGKKSDNADFSMEDIDLITQASTQTAQALQNIKLQSVYIEKKRIDKELELARIIQRRLLPRELPKVIGLEVYGESRSCLEVAGDYYDVINIDNNNTVFVVADVSGKGAGAAMIMANLQASIRVGIEISENLSNFVTRINNHVFNHTSSAEFITFFMAIWVPESQTLYYVNAGHNPPILLDKSNNVTWLEATGMLLGIMENQEYTTAKAEMKEDSLLLIYTDGIEEAINLNNELFGTERIIDLLITNRNSPPASIAEELNKAVLQFSGESPICDDITMIIAKSIIVP